MGDSLNDWFPVNPTVRRGRSETIHTFTREALGAPIRSQISYAWVDSLLHENELRMRREDSDPVYRGDGKPGDSCALVARQPLPSFPDGAPAGRALTPEPRTAPSDARVSPTPAECLSSPTTPLPPRLRTYTKRDQNWMEAERLTIQRVMAEQVTRRHTARSLACGDARAHSSLTADPARPSEQLLRSGHVLHRYIDKGPCPLLNRNNYVPGAVAGGPKGKEVWWATIVAEAVMNMGRLYRNGSFAHLGKAES
ncbi:hypothetical protein B0H17DRAFT_1220302 [Mycena rosella]|uniref:Uncharacterized protein n=1 Tax=Mycena rosella TaxID=1033263 RepID=A0AAD7BBM7_MYCRO|nr:hypothetical protein B0H17DRAFT_1220302 [Mycena rosella]